MEKKMQFYFILNQSSNAIKNTLYYNCEWPSVKNLRKFLYQKKEIKPDHLSLIFRLL